MTGFARRHFDDHGGECDPPRRLHLRQHESSADSLEEADRQSREMQGLRNIVGEPPPRPRQEAPRFEIYRYALPDAVQLRTLRARDLVDRLRRTFDWNPLRWLRAFRALTDFRKDIDRALGQELFFGGEVRDTRTGAHVEFLRPDDEDPASNGMGC